MSLRRGLKWGCPQYTIAGTCIRANKSNPINSWVHVGGPQYSISSTCIWTSKSNPMGLKRGKGRRKACEVAGVLKGCNVGDVNERRTM